METEDEHPLKSLRRPCIAEFRDHRAFLRLDSGHSQPMRWSCETGRVRLASRYLSMVSALPLRPRVIALPSQSISKWPKKRACREGWTATEGSPRTDSST